VKRFIACFFVLAVAGLTFSAQGDVWVYDSFGVGGTVYTNNAPIDGEGHGDGWAASWDASNDNFVTRTGSIVPASVPSQDGVMVRAGGESTSESAGRQYTPTFGGANPTIGEAWFSFGFQRNVHERSLVINPFDTNNNPGAGQFFGVFADNFSTDLKARIRYGGAADVADSVDAFTLTLGTEYFIVGHATFNPTGTADVLDVYVFESASFDGTLPGSPTMTTSFDLDSSFNHWTLSSQNPQGNTNVLVYDEFRIGETFQDVTIVPEPTTAAAALGLCAMIAARRRRSSM